MEDSNFSAVIEKIAEKDLRYDAASYSFINDAVTYTVKKMNKSGNPRGMRHVSGQELVAGVCEYAIARFGPLAADVLEYWGIRSGPDVGNIVYNMIGMKLLSASSEDSRSDFDCEYDLTGTIRKIFETGMVVSRDVKLPVIE